MPTPQKEQTVSELREAALGHGSALLADYRGLRVTQLNQVRRRVREAGGQLVVVKNRLFKLALADTPGLAMVELLSGPTAVAFTNEPAGTAKALADAAREFEALQLKGGFVEGRVLDAAQVQQLATLPSREELIAQALAGLTAPLSGLAGTLREIIGKFVRTLQAVADQKAAA